MKEFFGLLVRFDLRGLLTEPTNNGVLQLFRYLFVGGCSFLIDFGVYCLLEAVGLHYLVAGVIAFIVSFAFNFFVSRILIFRTTAAEKANARELLGVAAISVTGLALTELLLYLGTDILLIDFRLSKIIASILVLFWNYAARKLFVYRKPAQKS